MIWKISPRSGACRGQEALLEEYLEGSLHSGPRQRLEAHLVECRGCSDALERARQGASLIQAGCSPAAGPGEAFTLRVMTGIAREKSRRQDERTRWRPLEVMVTRLAFSAALALGALLSVTMWAHHTPKSPAAQAQVLDLMPEPAHVTAATNDVLMAAISEDHGK
jgi:predicted anti-sigma-YlaC factor YlaD